jgi:hypothetical protein
VIYFSPGPLDHAMGKGYVKAHRGHYYNAIYTKRIKTVPLIVEVLGGIGPHVIRQLKVLARRARGPTAIGSYGVWRHAWEHAVVLHAPHQGH